LYLPNNTTNKELRVPTKNRDNEYRYIAFDERSKSAIGYGPRAVSALQYADQMNSQASIFVIDSGEFGYEVWTLALDLLGAERLIRQNERAPG
jgi:hypothetical protein